jgi:hypothetical protein
MMRIEDFRLVGDMRPATLVSRGQTKRARAGRPREHGRRAQGTPAVAG